MLVLKRLNTYFEAILKQFFERSSSLYTTSIIFHTQLTQTCMITERDHSEYFIPNNTVNTRRTTYTKHDNPKNQVQTQDTVKNG